METIHLCIVIATLLVVLYADEQGLVWVLGKKPLLSHKELEFFHVVIGMGLSLIILTGGLMFIGRASYLLSQPTFITKMVLVLALVINSFAIGSFAEIASKKRFCDCTSAERTRVFVSAAVSSVGWFGAAICGLLL